MVKYNVLSYGSRKCVMYCVTLGGSFDWCLVMLTCETYCTQNFVTAMATDVPNPFNFVSTGSVYAGSWILEYAG